MANGRRDDWVTDAQGRALSGTLVYYCTQPANTSVTPPTPLASIFSNIGGTAEANPQVTDGFGHAVAYAEDSLLYTIVYSNPIFGATPIILTDQSFGPPGGGSSGNVGFTPFAGVPTGAVNGSNTTFVLNNVSTPLPGPPVQLVFWVNFPLINGQGFTFSGNVVTTAQPPQVGDQVYATGLY